VLGQESAPVVEEPMRGDGQGPSFVGGRDEAEMELGAGVVQRVEAHFVKIVAQQRIDGLADGVVGQSPVQGLDQVGCGEVPDPVPGLGGGLAKGNQRMRLTRPGRDDQSQVLLRADPFQ
jgi:hypothetical protein